MEMSVEPDYYEPSFKDGVYQDTLLFTFVNGIKCPCCSRENKVYKTRTQFKLHTKTKRHNLWITHLNENRVNYYSRVLEQEKTIRNQQIQLATLQNDLTKIQLFINQFVNKNTNVPVLNLLELDLDS
jgi:hypothetical protein